MEVSTTEVKGMFNTDFHELEQDHKRSVQDQRFLNTVSEGIHQREDGHFEMPLPLKGEVMFPNNKAMAIKKKL